MTTVLILNESRLVTPFTPAAVAGKEIKLRQALPAINSIVVISLPPNSHTLNPTVPKPPLSKVTLIHTLSWPYYFSSIILFVYGFWACLKYRPTWIEAESPIFSGLAAIFLGKIFRLPVYIEIRSDFVDLCQFRLSFISFRFKKYFAVTLQTFTLCSASGIIANSRGLAARYTPSAKPVVVVNPGLQPTSIKTKSYEINPLVFHLGYLGRLVPEKGVSLLISAVSQLRLEKKCPPFTLYVAGIGPTLPQLKLQVSQNHLESIVKFVGFQESVSFISTLHVLINPCLVNAPLEMVQAEAAALGIPVICFHRKDTPETVSHEHTGLVVKNLESHALTHALFQFLTEGKLRANLHRHGPQFAQTNFAFMSQVQTLQKFYQSQKLI